MVRGREDIVVGDSELLLDQEDMVGRSHRWEEAASLHAHRQVVLVHPSEVSAHRDHCIPLEGDHSRKMAVKPALDRSTAAD